MLFKALTSYISPFGQQQVSDVILRAKKWRKKALATKEIGKDPEVLLYIRNTEISCVYLQYILSIYIVLYASHAQMTTEEVRPDARARRRAMIEVRVAASQLLAPWSPVTVNLCDAHAFVYIHTMCRQSPCSATHAHANEYTQYIIHICHATYTTSLHVLASSLHLVTHWSLHVCTDTSGYSGGIAHRSTLHTAKDAEK